METTNLGAKDFFPTFENLDYLFHVGDRDSLIVEIDLIRDYLSKELLNELESNFPEVVNFIRVYCYEQVLKN